MKDFFYYILVYNISIFKRILYIFFYVLRNYTLWWYVMKLKFLEICNSSKKLIELICILYYAIPQMKNLNEKVDFWYWKTYFLNFLKNVIKIYFLNFFIKYVIIIQIYFQKLCTFKHKNFWFEKFPYFQFFLNLCIF